MGIPTNCEYLIIGAGIHGLSTAWHLCQKLSKKGQLKENSVVVLEKTKVADGASGVACGIVRNNYYQPAMRRLMDHSIKVWNANADALTFKPVGYMQINSELMREGMSEVYEQQKEINFESTFIEGKDDCDKYMKDLLPDWQAEDITSVLHEKNSGYGANRGAIEGFYKLALNAGAKVFEGVEVTNLLSSNGSGSISAVETSEGKIECTQLVVAAGPWVRKFWEILELPNTVKIKKPDGTFTEDLQMWSYMALEEGELEVDPHSFKTSNGKEYPVIHVDTEATLISNKTGEVIHENEMWGFYYKPDVYRNCIQGGSSPYDIQKSNKDVAVDPYGHNSLEFQPTAFFEDKWTSAMAFCQKQFDGCHGKYRKQKGGGIGCVTPDRFPVFDQYKENVYIIADANHGYKMAGIGDLVSEELLGGKSDILEPFRFSRYEEGKLHPVSKSPFPWS
ncbi:MAG: monomeric sarcosine oxidase [Pelagibacteraceae bacterium]|nr:monomeric sarcosine oxidase [Pelagibacteraceae bacterium]|tara:strand:- start:1029 stop:2375 length:1347 start_codon:yes stop_codon:yes gene_type:complete